MHTISIQSSQEDRPIQAPLITAELDSFWGVTLACSACRVRGVKIGHQAITYRNGLTDYDQIWCVLRDQLQIHVTQVMNGLHLHVQHVRMFKCAPPPFRISETIGRIALKFGVMVRDQLAILYV